MANTVPLSAPITTHSGEVTSLTLRKIKASDIVDMKQSPFQVLRREGGEVELLVKYDTMMKYLSRLSGVDESLLGAMDGQDFQSACNKVGDIWNGLGE